MVKAFLLNAIVLATVLVTDGLDAKELSGAQVYQQNCVVCHGDDGSGSMPGVPDLSENRGWLRLADKELLERIKAGIQTPDVAVTMPPNGGNPELTEVQLIAAIEFLKKIVAD